MNYEDLLERMAKLEFHQKLLLKMVSHSKDEFYKLIIEKSLSQEEVGRLLEVCERMSKEMQKQKAEGFVHFLPLYKDFETALEPRLGVMELIDTMLAQGLYVPLMREFKKYTET